MRPWHREFSPFDVDELVNLVLTGCYIVVAALSGLRHSELAEMRRGCVRAERLANGKVRHRIHTQVIKGRDLGGEPDRWTVIEEVAQAFALVEALVDDDLPFARRGRGFRGRYRTFLRWVNGPGAQAFLAPIPEHWHLNGRQFRRTLAQLLGSRTTACWPARSTSSTCRWRRRRATTAAPAPRRRHSWPTSNRSGPSPLRR